MNIGELFEVKVEQPPDVVKCAVGLAGAGEIDVRDAVGKLKFAVAGKAVKDQRQTLILFDNVGSLEEFVQDSADEVLRRRDKARHRDLVGEFAVDKPLVIREVDVHFYERRRACGERSLRGGWGTRRRKGWRNRRRL